MMYRAQVKKHRDKGINVEGSAYDCMEEVQAKEKSVLKKMDKVMNYAVMMPLTVGWGVIMKIGEDWSS